MISKGEIKFLKKDENKNYAEIGRAIGVTRQRIWSKATGYTKKYQKKESYLEYRRHYVGHTRPYKPCKFCKEELTIDKSENLLYNS